MDKPDKLIRVGSLDWEIDWDCDLSYHENMGECHYGERLIRIDRNLEGRDERQALLHEICHAIAWSYTITLPRSKKSSKVEESIISQFVGPFLDVMESNPDVAEYLFGTLS